MKRIIGIICLIFIVGACKTLSQSPVNSMLLVSNTTHKLASHTNFFATNILAGSTNVIITRNADGSINIDFNGTNVVANINTNVHIWFMTNVTVLGTNFLKYVEITNSLRVGNTADYQMDISGGVTTIRSSVLRVGTTASYISNSFNFTGVGNTPGSFLVWHTNHLVAGDERYFSISSSSVNASNVNYIWPSNAPSSGQLLQGASVSGSNVTLIWASVAGSGDVTASANLTDLAITIGDGGAKGIKTSGILIQNGTNLIAQGTNNFKWVNITNLLNVDGAAFISNGLTNNGPTRLNSTLFVDGTVTIVDDVNVSSGAITISANGAIATLVNNGYTTFNTNLTTYGTNNFAGIINASNTVRVLGSFIANSSSSFNGAATFNSTAEFNSTTTFDAANTFNGLAEFHGGANFLSAAVFTSTITAQGINAHSLLATNWIQSQRITNTVAIVGQGTLLMNGNATFQSPVTFNGLYTSDGTTVSTITSDNTAIDVSNDNVFFIQSNSGTSTDRTITISSVSGQGQEITLIAIGLSNTWELQDSGNCKLAGTFTGNNSSTITLVWDGTSWVETGRSLN